VERQSTLSREPRRNIGQLKTYNWMKAQPKQWSVESVPPTKAALSNVVTFLIDYCIYNVIR